eukprot:s1772_g5.t1
MPEGDGAATGSEEKVGNNLWNLLPSFDPSQDNAKEYTDKVKFLWGICPVKDRPMLAPRLALLCRGTAWSQVKAIDPSKLTEPEGYKVLLKALASWEESSELQTYELFEKAVYRTTQKPDETAMSYVNRINVAFAEVGDETTLKQVKAFVMLRQSGLGAEDKKRVIAMADGYEPSKMEQAMRALSTKVLNQGDVNRKKIYPVNVAEDEFDDVNYAQEEEPDEDTFLAMMLEEGDESAMTIQDFEENIVQVCQDSPELSMAFTAYQDARFKLREKARIRGFWPLRSSSKGKGKNKKGKGFGKARQSLAERISNSNCRLCGARGHWKQECPQRDRQSSAADANVMVTEENLLSSELVDTLPENAVNTMWEASSDSLSFCVCMPPEQHLVNEEFIGTTSHFLHESKFSTSSKMKSLPSCDLRKALRKACETSFSVVRSPVSDRVKGQALGEYGTGIIDTGASKTVIGEKRVHHLLATLKADHRDLVKWQKSETVFRFGNNETLKSLGAMFIPFGKRWLKVEVVQGWTPFLISNAFLSALHADLHISKSLLKIPKWGVEVKLRRNSKGLFTVALTELIESASASEGTPCSEEVITMAWNDQPNQSREVYCTHQLQQQPTAAATVAQPHSERYQVSDLSSTAVIADRDHGAPEGDVLGKGPGFLCDGAGSEPRTSAGCPGGSQLEFRSRANRESPSSTRSDKSEGMGREDSAGRKVEESHLCRSLRPGHEVCELHGRKHQACLPVGTELSPVCQTEDSGRSSVQGEEDSAGTRAGDPHSSVDCCSGNSGSEFSSTRMGADFIKYHSDVQDECLRKLGTLETKFNRSGRDHGYDTRAGESEQGGKDASIGAVAARDGSTPEGDGQSVRGLIQEDPTWKSTNELSQEICLQIESAQLTIEKELAQLKSIWHGDISPDLKSPWKLDLLEIYCEQDSQITEHAQRLGLKARRFTFQDGDLSTSAGREALWRVILEEKPREIWVAPDCKYWGNFSRRNMGRSHSTASKILEGRKQQRVHLGLCQQIYWHQMDVGGHFHLEQPQGSEAVYQPELRDVYEGTLCTTFDMCEVGRLLAPWSQYRFRGNNFLRKRTNVFTSSKIFHQAFDSRLCPGNHQHTPIAGKVYHLGRWISLSEYAARYSSGFGKNVARYLACRIDHPPLMRDELLVGDVSPAFVQAVVARKREAISQDAPDEPQPDIKRQKYGSKQPPRGPFGCAHGEFWNGVFAKVNSSVPRVGKRVLLDGDEFDHIQHGMPGIKVRRVEICRGTERLRVPDPEVDRAEIPLRVTVVKGRQTGQAEVLGPAEEWVKLPKSKQTRKGKPAKMSLTVFGSPLNNGGIVGAVDPPIQERSKNGNPREKKNPGQFGNVGEDDCEPTPEKVLPRGIAQHGPGCLALSGEEKTQLRRLHHNLGHPATDRFVKFLKERHADPKIVQGALDFQCDSCAESKRGTESSRPAAIHDDLGFNQVVGMDTAVWTNSVGQQFSFTHVIDEGTLFHLGAPVTNTDAETQVQTFGRVWLLWAGPPQTVYVDPATEFQSDLWKDTMQSLDVHIKMSVGAAHWQLGRVEIHGSIIKRMLDKMDTEKPIRDAKEFEASLTQAFNAKNSLSRVNGYSPEQAVLGMSRRLPGSLTANAGVSSMSLAEGEGHASDIFRLALERRSSARKAFIDADNSSSLRRALLRRSRPLRGPYEIGDLVLYWRRKGSNLKRERGRWFGPASVVAVEGTKNVWLNHSGRLIRACPEQIRPASFREWKMNPESKDSTEGSSASAFAKNLKGGVFIDLDGEEIPDVGEESEGYEPSILERGSSLLEPDGEKSAESPPVSESPEEEVEKPLSPREIPVPSSDSEAVEPYEIPVPSDGSSDLEIDGDESLLFGDDVVFGVDTGWDIWELEIPLETKQEVPVLCASSADESVLLVSDAKKRKVEVKLSTLKSEDQFRMAVAKHKEALGMRDGEQCQLVGGAYGRVDAPYLWFCKFRDTLIQEGYVQCPMDPCVFTLVSTDASGQQSVHGSLGIHVDDGIGGGDHKFLESLERIRKKFNFGSFEKGSFVFTGIRFKQWDDKSIEFDQIEYIEKIAPLEIPRHRRLQETSPIFPEETTQLRSMVGALQYAAVHTRPDLSAKVGELQSCISRATVQDLLKANKVLFEAKTHKVSLMTVPIAPEQVSFCAFSDASFLSGTEKYAHQGSLIFATTPELLNNKKTVVAPVAWISKKIQRVTRSTLGAEAIALSGTVDRLLWIRLLWEWLNNPNVDWRNPEEALQRARKAALVTDCKSAYDLLTRTAIPQFKEPLLESLLMGRNGVRRTFGQGREVMQ